MKSAIDIRVSRGPRGYPGHMRLGEVTLTTDLQFHYRKNFPSFALGCLGFIATYQ
jgi:hypothetical protein